MGAIYDYCLMWNMVNYPAGVVPVTSVLEGEDQVYEDGINDILTKAIRDDIKGSVGMPIAVQVISYAFQDEVALGVMKAIDEKVRFRSYAPI